MDQKRILLISTIVFAVIIAMIYAATGNAGLTGGLTLALFISIAISVVKMSTSWEGTITEIQDKHYADKDGGFANGKTVRYAYIKTADGSSKKVASLPDWKVGDKLIKEKGVFSPRKG